MDRSVLVVVVLAWASSACESPVEPLLDPEVAFPDVRSFVTSDVARQLDPAGRFGDRWGCDGRFGEVMTAPKADSLAVTFARRYLASDFSYLGTPGGQWVAEQHGHAIDWDRVDIGERPTLCAESPFEPMPSDFHPAGLNNYGPHYLVPLYVADDQVALVSVAAMSPLSFDHQGPPRDRYGNEFTWTGPPHGHPYGVPLSPEAAVKLAAEHTDALVSALPRLLQPGHRVAAHQARWEATLNREVRCARLSDGVPAPTRTLYVGLHSSIADPVGGSFLEPRLFVADEEQPAQAVITTLDQDGEPSERLWPLSEGVPVDFSEVTCAPG